MTLSQQLREAGEKATPGPVEMNPRNAWIDCAQLDENGYPTPILAMAWPTRYRSEEETRANAHLIVLLRNNLDTIIAALEAQGAGK